jgi:hypothetical protein
MAHSNKRVVPRALSRVIPELSSLFSLTYPFNTTSTLQLPPSISFIIIFPLLH